MPEPYRDLALVRATALEFDTLKPEEVIARLEPLSKPGKPWFASAGELTAMAYLKQGRSEQAGKLFAAIAADTGRAGQRAQPRRADRRHSGRRCKRIAAREHLSRISRCNRNE